MDNSSYKYEKMAQKFQEMTEKVQHSFTKEKYGHETCSIFGTKKHKT